MNEYLDSLALDDLDGDQKELAECIGIEAYIKLVKCFGGLNVYVYKPDSLVKIKRDEKIKSEFNGHNYRYLALKYNLAENTVRQIVSSEIKRIKNEPLINQLSFYEDL